MSDEVTILTDSESSLKKIFRNSHSTPLSLKEANSTEYPLIQEIRKRKNAIQAKIKFKWVKSHQDGNLSKEAKMNQEADTHANLQHGERGWWKSRNTMGMLPEQKVQIFFDGDQYDRDYKLQASRHYHGQMAETYIRRKLQITQKAM